MRIKNLIQILNLFLLPPSLVLNLLGHNFWSKAFIEKNYIPMKIINFSFFYGVLNFKKLWQKSARKYLPWRDKCPLGVNNFLKKVQSQIIVMQGNHLIFFNLTPQGLRPFWVKKHHCFWSIIFQNVNKM